MPISRIDVEKIADLARLELTAQADVLNVPLSLVPLSLGSYDVARSVRQLH